MTKDKTRVNGQQRRRQRRWRQQRRGDDGLVSFRYIYVTARVWFSRHSNNDFVCSFFYPSVGLFQFARSSFHLISVLCCFLIWLVFCCYLDPDHFSGRLGRPGYRVSTERSYCTKRQPGLKKMFYSEHFTRTPVRATQAVRSCEMSAWRRV